MSSSTDNGFRSSDRVGSDLVELAKSLLTRAAKDEELEVMVSRTFETEIRVHGGEVENFTSAQSSGVGVRLIKDGRQGLAYVGSLDPQVIGDLVDQARDNARYSTPDEYNLLAEPDGHPKANIDLFAPGIQGVESAQKVAMALELERLAGSVDGRVRLIESTDYSDSVGEVVLLTSTGIQAEERASVAYVSSVAIAGEGDDAHTGYGFSVGREPALISLETAANDAVSRAVRLLGARPTRSGRVTVVFEPKVTASVLGLVGSALSAEAVLKGRSMFVGRLGEQVGSSLLTLIDDPTDQRAFGASRVDAEGLACRPNTLVDSGRLVSFLHNSSTAKKMGTVSNGCAVRGGLASIPGAGARALRIAPGDKSPGDLLEGIDRGVLVQSVIGLHSGANPATGDFSVGVEGVEIVDSELAGPIRSVTIASTLPKLLLSVDAVGNDVEWLPGSTAGVSLRATDMALSGI